MAHDPLSPTEALRTPIGALLAVVSLFSLVYSLVFAAQLLFGLTVVLLLSVGPYLSYRLFAALDSLADGAQRIADAREREARGGDAARFDRPADRDRTGTRERTSERETERER